MILLISVPHAWVAFGLAISLILALDQVIVRSPFSCTGSCTILWLTGFTGFVFPSLPFLDYKRYLLGASRNEDVILLVPVSLGIVISLMIHFFVAKALALWTLLVASVTLLSAIMAISNMIAKILINYDLASLSLVLRLKVRVREFSKLVPPSLVLDLVINVADSLRFTLGLALMSLIANVIVHQKFTLILQ